MSGLLLALFRIFGANGTGGIFARKEFIKIQILRIKHTQTIHKQRIAQIWRVFV